MTNTDLGKDYKDENDPPPDPGKRRSKILRIPQDWEQFLLSVLYSSLLPFVPIFLELWFNSGVITITSLCLTTAIYSVTVGISSSMKLILGVGFIFAIIFSAVFGVVSGGKEAPEGAFLVTGLAVLILTAFNVIDRWNRHMAEKEKFLNFNDDE